MSIGSFMLVKNEKNWIAPHILRVLPYIDEMVFFDGNSTDGTLEIIKAIKDGHSDGHKIKLFENQDPKDLRGAYVEAFNSALHSLRTDLAWFLHPDMWVANPERILEVKDSQAIALTSNMTALSGEPGGELLQIKGRQSSWKNIYRLRNPDVGAHYFGHYGAAEEDVYFSAITGAEHIHYGNDTSKYPYEIEDSGINVLHFSDVRTLDRRIGRMRTCLENQGYGPERIESILSSHPRVTLKPGADLVGNRYDFTPFEYPAQFLADQSKYKHLVKEPELV